MKDPISLEPFYVRASKSVDGGLVIDAYDAGGLFERASRAFGTGRYSEARELYRRVAREFSDSSVAPVALYNSGLMSERLGDYRGALRDYKALWESYPNSADVVDALFRGAGAAEKLENFDEAVRIFDILIQNRADLEGVESVEALARKGSVLLHLDRLDEAEIALKKAVYLFRAGRGISPSASNYYYAMAEFKLGEILHSRMHKKKLSADEATLEVELEDKCRLLLDAQRQYTRVIKAGHQEWAAAAAYRIGHLYRVLWEDMLASPVPEDLDQESREIYLEVLKKRLRVLLKKAITQWERTLKMARRLELKGEWVRRTEQELEEIREIITGE